MRTSRFLPIAAIVLAMTPFPAKAAYNPITVRQCFISVPKHFSHKAGGTQITYVNTGKKTAVKVTIAVGYRNAEGNYLRRVDDVGTFAPGTPVDHHFSLYSDVTYAGKQTTSCRAVAVKWADGTSWHI